MLAAAYCPCIVLDMAASCADTFYVRPCIVPDPSCCYPCRLSPIWIRAPFLQCTGGSAFLLAFVSDSLADHSLSPRPPLQPRQHAVWHPTVARSDMHAVLLTPAVMGRYMHAELLSDEPNVSLAFHFSLGQRLKARPALAVQLSRRVEEQLGAFVLPSQIRSTILAICEPTQWPGLQLCCRLAGCEDR